MSLGERNGIELHLFSPRQADELVELLTVVAHYHRTGARLGLYHTVNFGRPWLTGATCEYGFISLPYKDDPGLEWLRSKDFTIRSLWLIPITEDERDYKKSHDAEGLETLFERAQFNYLNPDRESIVKR